MIPSVRRTSRAQGATAGGRRVRRVALIAMLVLAGAASMPATASGQANERLIGFRVGLVTSSTEPVDTPDFPDTEASTGLTAGAVGRLPVGERLAFQGELNYARSASSSRTPPLFRYRRTRVATPGRRSSPPVRSTRTRAACRS